MEDPHQDGLYTDEPRLVPVIEIETIVDEFGRRRRQWRVVRWVTEVQSQLEGKPWKQFFAAMAFFLSSATVMTFSLNFVHYRMPDPTKYPSLPDFVHDLVPMQEPTVVSELLFHLTIIVSMGSGIWYYRYNFWPLGTRYLIAWGVSWYIRVIALLSTSLPATESKHCRYDYPNFPVDFPHPIPSIWWNTFVGVVSGGSSNIHCGDLLFSGHSVVVAMNWLFTLTYMRHNKVLVGLSTLLSFAKLFLIIAERNHYTIDVLVSLYVSATVWQMTPEHIPYWLSAPFEAVINLPRRIRRMNHEEPIEV